MTFPTVFRLHRRELPALRVASHPAVPLVDEVNRLFEDFFRDVPVSGTASPFVPSLEIEEASDAVKISAELPGLGEKDFELSIEDGVFTLRGEKRAGTASGDGAWTRSERSYGRFERRITLPCEVIGDKARAEFKNGVLSVTLPKLVEAKAKAYTIPVEAT